MAKPGLTLEASSWHFALLKGCFRLRVGSKEKKEIRNAEGGTRKAEGKKLKG